MFSFSGRRSRRPRFRPVRVLSLRLFQDQHRHGRKPERPLEDISKTSKSNIGANAIYRLYFLVDCHYFLWKMEEEEESWLDAATDALPRMKLVTPVAQNWS